MPEKMSFKVIVSRREQHPETTGERLLKAAHQLGLVTLESCMLHRLFFLQGTITPTNVTTIAQQLLADPVTETFAAIEHPAAPESPADITLIEVTRLPGVTDPAAENLLHAAHRLGITGLAQVSSGQQYRLTGDLSPTDLHRLATEILSNPVIEQAAIGKPIIPPFLGALPTDDTVDLISLQTATDDQLLAVSAERRLALNLPEMQAIRAYYQQQQRDPSDVELEMLAQTWSEHCVHKTFKATIQYSGPQPGSKPNSAPVAQPIPGLFKTYIRAATEQVNKPWLRSVFVDNAGIIKFDDTWDVAFKVETHNHPSALEPFGGANTGVGGVVRDVIGVSAKPIANTDVLCFGPPTLPQSDLPAGVLHPQRIADGVIHGVEDYGNKMGIPTVNGAILYHPGYTANPLVFCGCLGLLPHGSHPNAAAPGDLVIVIGGRTGRDGLRGATFSSMEMDQTTGQIAGSAVQIGHPINEKQALEVVLQARDQQLYTAITDCGAGGLSSAVGEMASTLGADITLDTVPLKYPGLRPWEIWLSEAQERMVLAVPPANWTCLQEICRGQDVEAVCIGQFTGNGQIRLMYNGRQVCNLEVEFLHNGIPLGNLQAVWQPTQPVAVPKIATDPEHALLNLLAMPNIRSKEAVVRRYDHEVQGATAVKPLVGADNHGPGDAAVLIPTVTHSGKGVALSAGICPAYGEIDPYAMAWAAIDESLRNLIAVGADPDQVAVLDNFCWGNPNLPDRLGGLVRCAQGCYDAALAYGVPFVSGKDSLNNEYTGADGHKHAIPGTLLISAMGIVPNAAQTVTMDLKQPGNHLYIIGKTAAELGGSHFYLLNNLPDAGTPPQPVAGALQILRAVHQAIAAGLVAACHDCSEGGLGVALAEMCLAGRLGALVDLAILPGSAITNPERLFSESLTRFIIEVNPQNAPRLESVLANVPHARIGSVTTQPVLAVNGVDGQSTLNVSVSQLESAWRGDPGITDQPCQPAQMRSDGYAPAIKTAAKVLILHANGTNRDHDVALACELAGGRPEIVHINRLIGKEVSLLDYAMLVIPGGFSYGDDLGAGTLWAFDLHHHVGADLDRFGQSGRPVLGICNGFQTLVKAGLLPGTPGNQPRTVTLTHNQSGHFECRWVYLQPNRASPSLFTAGLSEPIYCPVAHGEGRIAAADDSTLAAIQAGGLNALTYTNADGSPAVYPANPNGSALNIAGLCNPTGNVLGLMPHPENHIFPWQHPRHQRGEIGLDGLRLFKNGVKGCGH